MLPRVAFFKPHQSGVKLNKPITSPLKSISRSIYMNPISRPREGDTLLHKAIREFTDIPTFHYQVKAWEETYTIYQLVRTVNDDGRLAWDLIDQLDYDEEITNKMKKILAPFISKKWGIKNLSALLDVNDFYRAYNVKPDSELGHHFKIACEATNQTRQVLKVSSTHPETNEMPLTARRKIHKTIDELRCSTKTRRMDNFEYTVIEAEKAGAGNCHEYTYVTMRNLHQIKPDVTNEAYIGQGHMFAVYGRDNSGDANDFTTWKSPTVVVDAWCGEIYPAKLIPKQLQGYRFLNYGNYGMNVLVNFNEAYHGVAKHLDFPGMQEFLSIKSNVSTLFANKKPPQFDLKAEIEARKSRVKIKV